MTRRQPRPVTLVLTDRGVGVLVGELPGPAHAAVVLVRLRGGRLVFRELARLRVLATCPDVADHDP